MAESLSTTSNGSGSQTNSQNPQSTGQLQSAGQQSDIVHVGSVQSSVPGVQLDNLGAQTLTVENSQPTSTSTAHVAAAKPPLKPYHINPVMLSLVVALLVAAAVLFWWTMRSAKNTTKYS